MEPRRWPKGRRETAPFGADVGSENPRSKDSSPGSQDSRGQKEGAARSATKVYNGLLWHLREAYKGTGKVDLSRKNLDRILKDLPWAKDYHSIKAPGFRRKGYLFPLRYV